MGKETIYFLQCEFTSMSYAGPPSDASASNEPGPELRKSDTSFSELGPLKENERRDLNCAVKEYLLLAGYRLTAMTFYEEVIYKKFTHMLLIASEYKDRDGNTTIMVHVGYEKLF